MKGLANKYSWLNAYLLLSAVMIYGELGILEDNASRFADADWRFPLNFTPPPNAVVYTVIGKTLFCSFLVLAAIPGGLTALGGLIVWSYWLAELHSFGVVENTKHGYFLVALGASVALCIGQKNRGLEYAIAAVMALYTSSGLWKLFGLFHGDSIVSQTVNALPFHMAYGLAENYSPRVQFFFGYFAAAPWLSGLMWLLVIAIEVALPVLVIFERRPLRKVIFILGFVGLHTGAYVMVGPEFTKQIWLLLFLAAAVYSKSFFKGSVANSMKAETLSGV